METLDEFGGAELESLIEELRNVRALEVAGCEATEKSVWRDGFARAVEAAAEGGNTGEFAAGGLGKGI